MSKIIFGFIKNTSTVFICLWKNELLDSGVVYPLQIY